MLVYSLEAFVNRAYPLWQRGLVGCRKLWVGGNLFPRRGLQKKERGNAFLRCTRMRWLGHDSWCFWWRDAEVRCVLSVTRGVPRVGNSAWLNAMQQRRHWRQRCRWLKVLVAIYLNNTQGSVYVAWRKERSFPRSFRRRTLAYVLKVSD